MDDPNWLQTDFLFSQAYMPLQSFRRLLMQELKLTRHHDVRLVLQDGTLLTEGQDEKPLCTVLALELSGA
jgi:hypothetical protein